MLQSSFRLFNLAFCKKALGKSASHSLITVNEIDEAALNDCKI
jgi:hypothetical protein